MPTFRFKVRSKSEPGKYHLVSWIEKEQKWRCDCIGYLMSKKECKHIRAVGNFMKGALVDVDKEL